MRRARSALRHVALLVGAFAMACTGTTAVDLLPGAPPPMPPPGGRGAPNDAAMADEDLPAEDAGDGDAPVAMPAACPDGAAPCPMMHPGPMPPESADAMAGMGADRDAMAAMGADRDATAAMGGDRDAMAAMGDRDAMAAMAADRD